MVGSRDGIDRRRWRVITIGSEKEAVGEVRMSGNATDFTMSAVQGERERAIGYEMAQGGQGLDHRVRLDPDTVS